MRLQGNDGQKDRLRHREEQKQDGEEQGLPAAEQRLPERTGLRTEHGGGGRLGAMTFNGRRTLAHLRGLVQGPGAVDRPPPGA